MDVKPKLERSRMFDAALALRKQIAEEHNISEGILASKERVLMLLAGFAGEVKDWRWYLFKKHIDPVIGIDT